MDNQHDTTNILWCPFMCNKEDQDQFGLDYDGGLEKQYNPWVEKWEYSADPSKWNKTASCGSC